MYMYVTNIHVHCIMLHWPMKGTHTSYMCIHMELSPAPINLTNLKKFCQSDINLSFLKKTRGVGSKAQNCARCTLVSTWVSIYMIYYILYTNQTQLQWSFWKQNKRCTLAMQNKIILISFVVSWRSSFRDMHQMVPNLSQIICVPYICSTQRHLRPKFPSVSLYG